MVIANIRRCDWAQHASEDANHVDETGKLEQMNATVGYKDDGGVEFTDEIKAAAIKLGDFPDGCAACGKAEREDGKALLLCARRKEKYCSTDCQKKRRKKHKKESEPA
jgi:hypothetical protein